MGVTIDVALRAAGGGHHAHQHLPAGLVAQQLTEVGDGRQGRTVDGEQDVAFGDVHPGARERADLLRDVRVRAVDVRHAPAALGPRERGAERRGQHLVVALPEVTAADEDVERGELAHQLRQQVRQLAPVRDPRHQRPVLLAHGRPVHAVHAAVVEVVPLEPPRVLVHLPQLGPRVHRERPAGERHLVSAGSRAPSRRRPRRRAPAPSAAAASSGPPSARNGDVLAERLRLRPPPSSRASSALAARRSRRRDRK